MFLEDVSDVFLSFFSAFPFVCLSHQFNLARPVQSV